MTPPAVTSEGFCWTCWTPPAGPGTPFAGMLLLPDVLRMVALALTVLSVALLVWSMTTMDNFPQRMRFVCMLMFSILIASIEVEHLGDTANWRLGFVLITLLWQTLSVAAFLRDRGNRNNRWP